MRCICFLFQWLLCVKIFATGITTFLKFSRFVQFLQLEGFKLLELWKFYKLKFDAQFVWVLYWLEIKYCFFVVYSFARWNDTWSEN